MRGVGIVLLLAMVAGCTVQEGAQPPEPSPRATDPPGPVADWTDPFEVVVANGWTVRECLGDAPDAEEGGCLPPSDTDVEFQPDDLEIFEPYLDDLVAATPLPPPDR